MVILINCWPREIDTEKLKHMMPSNITHPERISRITGTITTKYINLHAVDALITGREEQTEMPARSHVDFCLFIQILEIEEDRLPDNLKTILRVKRQRPRRARSVRLYLTTRGGSFVTSKPTCMSRSTSSNRHLPFLYWIRC